MDRKDFLDTRYGFPVLLKDAPVEVVLGEEVAAIDEEELHGSVVAALILKTVLLTGYEIRFLRLWMGLSAVEFGEKYGVTHPAVLKWQGKNDAPSLMNKSTEILVRIDAIYQLVGKSTKASSPSFVVLSPDTS